MSERTVTDLMQMQSLPLNAKISMSRNRINAWVNEYGEDGVYISFSGGKDSTVLLDLVREECGHKNIPAVFVDVPTQYPELRDFAKTFDNVTIIKPKISFMEVCEKYGFPLISKEVSNAVYDARTYLNRIRDKEYMESHKDENIGGHCAFADVIGVDRRQGANKSEEFKNLRKGILPDEAKYLYEKGKEEGKVTCRTKSLFGELEGYGNEGKSKRFNKEKYKFFLEADFDISDKCCKVMKKEPLHRYNKETGRHPMTAQMAQESQLRTQQWIKNGCNGFQMKSPMSNPMSFWTEQDVLQYIKKKNLPICSVYGEIVPDIKAMGQVEGQLTLFEVAEPILKTTGCKRTGCMLCGFGCHLEKEEDSRFLLLKETHEKMYNLLDVCKNNGVTFREAIEWTNEHGNLNIHI